MKEDSSSNRPIDEHPLMPLDELCDELKFLEAEFISLTDDELRERVRRIHNEFRVSAPLFNPGEKVFRGVRVDQKPLLQSRLSYPPGERVRVNGRLNRAGEVMFYGSLGSFSAC